MPSGTPDQPEQVTVIFKQPVVRPGTPEAQARGCICRFEINMEAEFLSRDSDEVPDDQVVVVIAKGCPLHRIVTKPMDDVIDGD